NTSHRNSNEPALSGVSSIRVTTPGTTSPRRPKDGRLNPCTRSSEVTSITTGSPFLTVISLTLNSNFLTDTAITRGDCAAEITVPATRLATAANAAAAQRTGFLMGQAFCTGYSVIAGLAAAAAVSTPRKPSPR